MTKLDFVLSIFALAHASAFFAFGGGALHGMNDAAPSFFFFRVLDWLFELERTKHLKW